MTRNKSSHRPNMKNFPVGFGSVWARVTENYTLTTKSKTPLRWIYFQLQDVCLQYGFVSKKEILKSLEVIVYVDQGPGRPRNSLINQQKKE